MVSPSPLHNFVDSSTLHSPGCFHCSYEDDDMVLVLLQDMCMLPKLLEYQFTFFSQCLGRELTSLLFNLRLGAPDLTCFMLSCFLTSSSCRQANPWISTPFGTCSSKCCVLGNILQCNHNWFFLMTIHHLDMIKRNMRLILLKHFLVSAIVYSCWSDGMVEHKDIYKWF